MIVGDKYIIDDINKVLRDFSINEDIELSYSQIDSVDVQCNNLVKYSKDLRINEILNNIIEKLEKNKYIKNATVGKNNFINLVLSNIYFDENITKKLIDLNNSEIFILWSLAIPILFFGFYPEPLINTIEVSINNLIEVYNLNLENYMVKNK